jgi:hypothetical protein
MRIILSLAPMQSEVTVTAERGTIADTGRTLPVVTVRGASEIDARPLATIGNVLEGAAGVLVQQSTYYAQSPIPGRPDWLYRRRPHPTGVRFAVADGHGDPLPVARRTGPAGTPHAL